FLKAGRNRNANIRGSCALCLGCSGSLPHKTLFRSRDTRLGRLATRLITNGLPILRLVPRCLLVLTLFVRNSLVLSLVLGCLFLTLVLGRSLVLTLVVSGLLTAALIVNVLFGILIVWHRFYSILFIFAFKCLSRVHEPLQKSLIHSIPLAAKLRCLTLRQVRTDRWDDKRAEVARHAGSQLIKKIAVTNLKVAGVYSV